MTSCILALLSRRQPTLQLHRKATQLITQVNRIYWIQQSHCSLVPALVHSPIATLAIMPSTWVEKAAGTSETARASRQQDRERIQREKEQEEAAAKQRLAEEKERHGKEAGAMEAEAQKGEEGIAHDSDDAASGSVPKDA